MKFFTQMDRVGRSLLTLNRDREYKILKQMLALSPTDHVLDVGSGDGFWTSRLAMHCGQITGLEPDERALDHARTLYQRPNVEYMRGSAESLPHPSGSFDKVVSVSCLEHFADPLQGLREIARVLKPGGRIAISVDSLLPENSPAPFREWHKHRHFVTHYFQHEELLGMMKTVGFRCEPERTKHLFRSRLAADIRQVFIRRPRVLLPLFPLFYLVVRLADSMMDDMHGQILVVTATRHSVQA
ncbi:MAG TPA: class I SAM-dependent methyltransferase [Nitrospira sp.]|nr:class I SAM-dependent methyltransferase [Nitrospira sp.]